jgi:hypothetical protein
MQKINLPTLAIGISLCFAAIAQADDLQFVTLPPVVQTTVIRETKIADGSNISHVVRDPNGVYAVTVRRETGDQVVYVNEAGALVQGTAAGTTTTTTTTVQKPVQTVQTVQSTQTVQNAQAVSPQVVVTYDQVQKAQARYQLLEKKGKKEVYLDTQTGEKVKVKREND